MVLINQFRKEYTMLAPQIKRAFEKVFLSGVYIQGPHVFQFERAFAQFCGAKYCVGTGNGMQAIEVALRSLGIGRGDEVITTALSAAETALAITATGATPVFVDIDTYFHLDTNLVERSITKRTRAIIPVHLYGQPADMATLVTIAKKHKLFVIEDACQAHGAYVNKRHVGTIGDIGCFSFYPTKNLGAYGDGGAILTNNKKMYELCQSIANSGRTDRYTHGRYGINSRLDELQAALLLVKLTQLAHDNKLRSQRATWYEKLLQNHPMLALPMIRKHNTHAYHQFVIRAQNRDALQKYLKKRGVETLVHYPHSIPEQPVYSGQPLEAYKEAQKATREVLSLPIHPFLTYKDIQKISRELYRFYGLRMAIK